MDLSFSVLFRNFANIRLHITQITKLVHFKNILTICLATVSMGAAQAQSDGVDQLPARRAAENAVAKVEEAVNVDAVVKVEDLITISPSDSIGEAIVQTALQYLGAKYRKGHSGPNAFDCSGFTSYIYGMKDISISRSSRTQYNEGTPINEISELKKGDLVFFGGSASSKRVGHVGIVTEVDAETNRFKFVHAARTGVKVDDSSSAYYARRFLGARRILDN